MTKLAKQLLESGFVPRGSYLSTHSKKYTGYSGPMPKFQSGEPDGEILVWYMGGEYLGWTRVNPGKSFARKQGGGSTRGGGAWLPGGDGPEKIGALAFLYKPSPSDTNDEEEYKNSIRQFVMDGNSFSRAMLYRDPSDKYDNLRSEYEKEIKELERELSIKYLERL